MAKLDDVYCFHIVLKGGCYAYCINTGSYFQKCTDCVFCMNHAFLTLFEPKMMNFKIEISVIRFFNFAE